MNLLSRDEFGDVLKRMRISKRLQRDIRYVPEEITHIGERDFLTVRTKSGAEGVLLFGDYCVPFSLKKRSANAKGRVEAIICDICSTWQRGTNSVVITFKTSDTSTVSHLVCGDLDCSLHVRDLTDVSKLSRTQLREHISPSERLARLHTTLVNFLTDTNQ